MQDVAVTRTLDEDDRSAVEALCAATYAADRPPALSDDHWIALHRPRTPGFAAFVARDGRRLVGYAQLIDEPGGRSLEVVVHPLHRDSSAAEDLTRAALALVADEGGATMQQLVVRATDADDVRAASLGLAPTRDLLQLRCELPLEMEPEWPAGIEVRTFQPGRDDDAWLAVNNRAFAGHPEQSEWDRARLADRTEAPWFDPAGFLLAVRGRDIAGFCWTKIHGTERLGEIYVIGVDPAYQGGGLGRALAIAGLASLAARSVPTGMLYVDAANSGAVAMYESLGFVEHHRDRWYTATVEGSR